MDFDGSAEAISVGLGIHLESVRIAVRELSDKGFLKSEQERILSNPIKIRWAANHSQEDIRKFHAQMLDRAKKELADKKSEEDFKRRLIMGITLTVPQSRVEEAKERLHNFIYELSNDLISQPGENVYHLSAQLIPLTKGK